MTETSLCGAYLYRPSRDVYNLSVGQETPYVLRNPKARYDVHITLSLVQMRTFLYPRISTEHTVFNKVYKLRDTFQIKATILNVERCRPVYKLC